MTKEICAACQAFQAECIVPVGDGAKEMCWLCAHHVVEHDVALKDACTAECECAPDQVYPMVALQRQQAAGLFREASRVNDVQGRYVKINARRARC